MERKPHKTLHEAITIQGIQARQVCILVVKKTIRLTVVYLAFLVSICAFTGEQVAEAQQRETEQKAAAEVETEAIEAPNAKLKTSQESTREVVAEITPLVSEEELNLLQRTVMAEAGGESKRGQRLVCAVILNRVESDIYADTIQGVIAQKGQFSSYPKAIWAVTPSKEVISAVNEELINRTDTQVLYFRTGHYHKGRTALYAEGSHYFSK